MIDSDDLSANAYELLIQGAVDYAIYMLDPKGYVVSWNPGAERIKGYTAGEIVGTHFSRFYTAATSPESRPARYCPGFGIVACHAAASWRNNVDCFGGMSFPVGYTDASSSLGSVARHAVASLFSSVDDFGGMDRASAVPPCIRSTLASYGRANARVRE
jgi:hypothetical protein